MYILGIETSCDETAAAVVEVHHGTFTVHSNIVSSQTDIHAEYGGVVPEVAARNHVINIIPVINQALEKAAISINDVVRIAVTVKPGLLSSLLIGTQTAKTIAWAYKKPLVPVDHLKAHVYAAWLNNQSIVFPAIALIVSGGHTQLVYMKDEHSFTNIGQTLDDAAGEAFDKVAKMMDLPYPGGPEISKLAQLGKRDAYSFPRPMLESGDLMFSFSGLKTAVLYTLKEISAISQKNKEDISASFEQAVVDTLTTKTKKAVKQHSAKTLLLAGGVAANTYLRETLATTAEELGISFIVPDRVYCTDNAAMIAAAGYFQEAQDISHITVEPN